MQWSTNLAAADHGSRRRRGRRLAVEGATMKKLALTALTLSVVVATVGLGTWAAFSATTVNTGNTFDTGSITLVDNDGGSAILTMSNAGPGEVTDGCIEVTYASSVGNATVRLFGDVAGDLAEHLTVVVTRSEVDGTCDTLGASTEVYNGTLDSFAADYASGIGGGTQWSDGTRYAYQFDVTLSTSAAAQGKDATVDFTWEARTV